MAEAADIGHGSSIIFSSGFFAKITSISWSGIHRDAIETTNMATSTAKTFIADDIYDPGELSVDIQFETDTDVNDPITAAKETCTVGFTTTNASHKWSADAFMSDYEITSPRGELMTATGTLKFTGAINLS